LKYLKIIQGHIAISAPAYTQSVSNSWLSCLMFCFHSLHSQWMCDDIGWQSLSLTATACLY